MYSLPVRGKTEQAPVNRTFLVGCNYHAHAVEMGRPVDKGVEVPFYFTQAPGTLVESGATVPYPPGDQQLPLRAGACAGDWQARVSGLTNQRRVADLRLCLRPGHDAARPATHRAREGPALGPGQGHRAVTGTPEGVGPVLPVQRIDGRIEGVGTIVLHTGPAE